MKGNLCNILETNKDNFLKTLATEKNHFDMYMNVFRASLEMPPSSFSLQLSLNRSSHHKKTKHLGVFVLYCLKLLLLSTVNIDIDYKKTHIPHVLFVSNKVG